MTSKMPVIARSLDIWEIIKSHITINEDYAVEQSTLYLDINGESFVDIHYYDLSEYKERTDDDEPKVMRYKLSIIEINKMYSNFHQVLNLPEGVHTLHTHLNQHEVAYLEVKMVPFFR